MPRVNQGPPSAQSDSRNVLHTTKWLFSNFERSCCPKSSVSFCRPKSISSSAFLCPARKHCYWRFGTLVNQLQVQNNRRLASRGRSAYGPVVVRPPYGGRNVTVVSASRCDQCSSACEPAIVNSARRWILTVFIPHDWRPIRLFYRS